MFFGGARWRRPTKGDDLADAGGGEECVGDVGRFDHEREMEGTLDMTIRELLQDPHALAVEVADGGEVDGQGAGRVGRIGQLRGDQGCVRGVDLTDDSRNARCVGQLDDVDLCEGFGQRSTR